MLRSQRAGPPHHEGVSLLHKLSLPDQTMKKQVIDTVYEQADQTTHSMLKDPNTRAYPHKTLFLGADKILK